MIVCTSVSPLHLIILILFRRKDLKVNIYRKIIAFHLNNLFVQFMPLKISEVKMCTLQHFVNFILKKHNYK